MPKETVGDQETVWTADHPPRSDSPEYLKTRAWLMGRAAGGCFVCGGPVDLSHPPGGDVSKGLQDHHGGGIYFWAENGTPVLVGLNLFGLEWSLGFGADPAKVAGLVAELNEVTTRLGGQPYTPALATVADVMGWVDSPGNANVKLCAPHHVGHENQHTPDVNGNEAVGIHNGPLPIWLGQVTCDWERWDMWGGSTGTLAVGHPGDDSKTARVLYVSPLHPDVGLYEAHRRLTFDGKPHVLPASHPNARLAHAGSHRD